MLNKHERIPRFAILIYTIIAVIVFGLGIYHFTQPAGAWRSGITEIIYAALLLAGAYLVPWPKIIVINLIVIVMSLVLGVRHLIHGGGWKSGIIELFIAVVLISVLYIVYNHRKIREV